MNSAVPVPRRVIVVPTTSTPISRDPEAVELPDSVIDAVDVPVVPALMTAFVVRTPIALSPPPDDDPLRTSVPVSPINTLISAEFVVPTILSP